MADSQRLRLKPEDGRIRLSRARLRRRPLALDHIARIKSGSTASFLAKFVDSRTESLERCRALRLSSIGPIGSCAQEPEPSVSLPKRLLRMSTRHNMHPRRIQFVCWPAAYRAA